MCYIIKFHSLFYIIMILRLSLITTILLLLAISIILQCYKVVLFRVLDVHIAGIHVQCIICKSLFISLHVEWKHSPT